MTRDAFKFFTGLAGAVLAVMGSLMMLPTPSETVADEAAVGATVDIEADAESDAGSDQVAATSTLEPGLIGTFSENGAIPAGEKQGLLPADRGFGWSATTDERMGGNSTVALRVEDGVLTIEGEIGEVFTYPWAGAIYFPGLEPMEPTDLSAVSELAFRARGEGNFRVMYFARSMGRIPPMKGFDVFNDWAEVRIDLRRLGGELNDVTALSIAAGGSAGPFRLEVDDVELR